MIIIVFDKLSVHLSAIFTNRVFFFFFAKSFYKYFLFIVEVDIENYSGLPSFKASEGWLDSFKRRHCIDLKAMTGKPVIYEADPEDANFVNDGLEIKIGIFSFHKFS